MVLAHVSPRPAAGEVHVFPVHANVLFLSEARPIPDTPKTLASTLPSGSVSPKITQKTWQGATPGHRTLPLPNFARCDTTTSHLATLSCCTLRHCAIAPCHFRLSHPAMQKARFCPLKSPCALVAPKFCEGASSRRRSAHAVNHPILGIGLTFLRHHGRYRAGCVPGASDSPPPALCLVRSCR